MFYPNAQLRDKAFEYAGDRRWGCISWSHRRDYKSRESRLPVLSEPHFKPHQVFFRHGGCGASTGAGVGCASDSCSRRCAEVCGSRAAAPVIRRGTGRGRLATADGVAPAMERSAAELTVHARLSLYRACSGISGGSAALLRSAKRTISSL